MDESRKIKRKSDEDSIASFWNKCFRYAKSKRCHRETAEDFAQYACMQRYARGFTWPGYVTFFVDWQRQVYGREPSVRNAKHIRKQSTKRKAIGGMVYFSELIQVADPSTNPYMFTLLSQVLEKLPVVDHWFVAEYFIKGRTLKAMGEELDLTESRLCQIISRIQLRLNKIFPCGLD